MTENPLPLPDPMACPNCGSTHLHFKAKLEYRFDGSVQRLQGGGHEISSQTLTSATPTLDQNNIYVSCGSCNRLIPPGMSLKVRARIWERFQSELQRQQQSSEFASGLARLLD